jgi:aerobic-type carbon monoxide dehydrogenase small subunit (CoxS/CutS family)
MTVPVIKTANGSVRTLIVEVRMTLLDCATRRIVLDWPKKSCDHGEGGACIVLVDGRRILSSSFFYYAARSALRRSNAVARPLLLHRSSNFPFCSF